MFRNQVNRQNKRFGSVGPQNLQMAARQNAFDHSDATSRQFSRVRSDDQLAHSEFIIWMVGNVENGKRFFFFQRFVAVPLNNQLLFGEIDRNNVAPFVQIFAVFTDDEIILIFNKILLYNLASVTCPQKQADEQVYKLPFIF